MRLAAMSSALMSVRKSPVALPASRIVVMAWRSSVRVWAWAIAPDSALQRHWDRLLPLLDRTLANS
jgi:hypothetical protein